MSIIVALLVFSFIVFIHELGHFYFARRGGIAVEEFAIGMGPKLFGFHSKGCEWTVRLLPIGGFCRMLGEDGESNDEKKAISKEELEDSVHQLIEKSEKTSDEILVESVSDINKIENDSINIKNEKSQLQGTAFYEQSVWIRISAVIGGPLFNFILALVFSFILMAVSTIATTEVSFIAEDSPAEAAGIQIGDVMVSVDGHRLVRPREASIYINVPAGDPIDVTVKRKGIDGKTDTLTYEIKPAVVEMDPSVPEDESENYYYIGVAYTNVETNFINVLKYGVLECLSWIKIVFYSLGLLITGQVSGAALSGPVALVSEISSGYERSLTEGLKVVIANLSFWIVLISANLGIMNLLPIPALDGGRLVFLSLEAILGKPIAPEKEGFIHFVGFVLLMALMVFVMYNDILRLFGWS